MAFTKKLKMLTVEEQLLKGEFEDRKKEIKYLKERLHFLVQEDVSATQKLNLLQIEIEDLK